MNLTRRSLVAGGFSVAALATFAPQAVAAPQKKYASIIAAPHQDDETIRLATYIARMADRGDDTALICSTNGQATVVGKRLGWAPALVGNVRDSEQDHAWQVLTKGRGGPVIRLGFPDGGSKRAAIRVALEQQFTQMSGAPEIYLATWHHDRSDSIGEDKHPDHVALVLACRDIAAADSSVVLRYARHPKVNHLGGARYNPTADELVRVRAAVDAYAAIGQRSVPKTFDALLKRPATVVTA